MYKLIYSWDLCTLSPFYMAAYTTEISRFTSDQAGDLLSTNRYLAILEILRTRINSSYEVTSRSTNLGSEFLPNKKRIRRKIVKINSVTIASVANGNAELKYLSRLSSVDFKKHGDQSSVFSDVKRRAQRHQFGTTFEHKRGLYNLKW
uniref:Uncharacterized protein n=1 Tax=Vespula pensylvanica TaxID=30213 RepID=A0A834KQ26_VESPE|nr:hypothetical protein H0235_013329 [Vespula pensylvanica]